MKKAIAILTLAAVLGSSPIGRVEAKQKLEVPFKVEASAFCDKKVFDETTPKENHTIAGKKSWLGMTAMIWRCKKNGKKGKFLGYFIFHDIGYGKPTGKGSSKLKKNASLGTIETGECIDIWMATEKKCREWGRRMVIIEIYNAKG